MSWYSDDPRLEYYSPLAISAAIPVDTFLFVIDALHVTPFYAGEEPSDCEADSRHCSAKELCLAIPHYAKSLFGTEWQAALHEMGLLTSDDLGQIVFSMVDGGLLQATAEDHLEDFIGVCRFVDSH